MYIENENYILRNNNSFGTVALFEKNKFGKKKYLFGFEYELSFEGDELLEITSINDKDKTGKEVIPIKYDFVLYFSEGLAEVKLNNKWFYINQKGE